MDYLPDTKGYKIYDPSHNNIIISGDVKLTKNVIPFATDAKQDGCEEKDIFEVPYTVEQKHVINWETVHNKPSETNDGPVKVERLDFNTTSNFFLNIEH